MIKTIAAGIAILVATMLLGAILTGYDFAMFKFWAPKYADAKRQVFENTQSYVQGKTAYINSLRLDYEQAEGPQKEALRRHILTEAATVDNTKLPVDLRVFISSLEVQ